MIYQALIQSHLNYMAICYAYRKVNSNLKSLQRMQNKALKSVYNLPRNFSTLSLFNNIAKSILPVHGLHIYQVLVYVFKCINSIGYHRIVFPRHQGTVDTRGRLNLRTPLRRLEWTKQRIDFVGPNSYNCLPLEIKSLTSISKFKLCCKNYILDRVETLLC